MTATERSTMQTFLELVDLLTKDTPTFILTDEGKKKQVTRVGLLEQLRSAYTIGVDSSGSSAFGSKPPIFVGAADLLEEIDTQASEVLVAVTHRPVPYGPTEGYVRLWAGQTKEDQPFTVTTKQTISMREEEAHKRKIPMVFSSTEQYTAYELVKRWVDRIEDFFNPPSSREIAAPCPGCNARYALRVSGGETVRTSALSILRDRDSGRPIEARCASCTRTWPPDQFEFLAKLVGAKPVPELVTEPDPKLNPVPQDSRDINSKGTNA